MTQSETTPEESVPEQTEHVPAYRRLLEKRAQPLPGHVQMIVTVVMLVGLVVASVWAWRSAHLQFDTINWVAIAVAFFVAAPVTVVLKMLEYGAAARLIGSRAAPRHALEVAVLSSAANLLPLPGSLLVTTRSLSEKGATYGEAAMASAIPGLAWLGLAGVIGGVAIGVAGSPLIGAVVTLGGIGVLLVGGTMFRRSAPTEGRVRLALWIGAIEGSWILISGFRLWLVLEAIGVSATPAQSLALALAGAMSVAIGFFPAGIGAREALIALLSPIIKLPLSEGVVLGVIDRVVWVTFLALAALFIVVARARTRSAVEAAAADASAGA